MKKMSEPIVFFGSGPVAAQSLELLAQDFAVEAVITKPKPAHHRGDFPVLQLAERLGLKTLTPPTKEEVASLFNQRPLNSRLGVVIDYGIIIPKEVIDYFSLGIVNSHFSLLPEWRGADPITFAILSGQSQTGVSLMLINEKLDEGLLLAQAPWAISPASTTPQLTQHLIELSYKLLVETLPKYVSGELKPYPQPDQQATYSRKLTKQDGLLDWQKPAQQLEREIRAFIDWPKSLANLAGKEVIITQAHVAEASGPAGQVAVQDKQLLVYTDDKALIIDRLKPAGKSEMTAQEFLAGYGQLLQ